VLHDIEGYRHEEIGNLLGVSIGTSKSQLHRARMTLRSHLNQGPSANAEATSDTRTGRQAASPKPVTGV
jgi:DNA-directed RNA polymerase specialized sigma24 family protein